MEALASANQGLTRNALLAATRLDTGGGFSTLLRELIECGFVMPIYPVGKDRGDALYRLVDEFTLLHFKFLKQQRGENSWQLITQQQKFRIWAGYAFENMCFKHLKAIKRALGIGGIISHACSWSSKGDGQSPGAQIDLLIDRADNCVNVLEIKFYDREFTITTQYASQLQRKIHVYKDKTRTRKNVFLTMITVWGVVKNEHYLSMVTNELDVTSLFD